VDQAYGYSYPDVARSQTGRKAEEFYTALLRFAEYWDDHLTDTAGLITLDPSWANMAKHSMARELMGRPGGVYPKYGAVDRHSAAFRSSSPLH